MQQSWATSSAGLWLQAILVATAITLCGMVAAYFQNLHEHQFSIFQLLPWTLLLWAGSILILVVITWLVSRALPTARYWLIPLIGVLLWGQGAFNVPNYGPLDGSALDWSTFQYLRETLLLIIVIGLFRFFRRQLQTHVFTLLGALLAVQLTYAVSAVFMADEPMPRASGADPKIHRLSETKNTFLIVLDAFQSDVFGEILQRRPELGKQLDGFVFFPDTVGTHPTTYGSVPTFFLGRPYKNEEPFQQFLQKVFSEHSILADFSNADYQVDLLRRAGLPNRAPMDYVDHLVSGNVIENTSRDRLEETLTLFEFTAFRHAPQGVRRLLYYHGIWTVSRLAMLGQPASVYHRSDLALLQSLERNAHVQGEQPVFRFIHFYTPHLPIVFDAQLRASMRPFNRETFADQAEAGLRLLVRFLDTLRAHDVYDNSRIIVIADHGQSGAGVHGHIPDLPEGKQHADPKSEMARIMATGLPLFLARDRGASGELKISRRPAHILDVAPSLVDELANRQQFEGHSVFTDATESARERYFYYYVWGEHGWGARYLDPIMVHQVTGHAWDANSWSGEIARLSPEQPVADQTTAAEVPDYRPGHMLDMRTRGNGHPYSGQGWSEPEAQRHWTIGEVAEIILPGEFESDRPYTLRMSVQPFVAPDIHEQQRLTVKVNDKELAQLELSNPRRQQLSLTIPADAVRQDELRILLITPDHASPAALGISSDPRQLGVSVTHLIVE